MDSHRREAARHRLQQQAVEYRQHLVDLATLADQRILGTIRKQLVTADQQNQ